MTDSAFDAWREQIAAHERDSAALRGGGQGHGHGHNHRAFERANRPLDPHRADDAVLNALYAILEPNAEVLDVGGGAGRFALPLATRARSVTVVEPSADSVEMLKSRAAEAGIANVTVVNETWEEAEAPAADVVLWAMNIFPDVTMLSAEPAVLDTDRDAAIDQLRRRLGVHEGDEADLRLRAAADELLEATPAGFVVRGAAPRRQAMVSWRPAGR